MSIRGKQLLLILASFAIGAAAILTVRSVVIAQKRTVVDEIPQPTVDRWIPFDADVRIFHTDGPNASGRFYRAADGSSRIETGPERQPIQVITIKNVPRRMYYVYSTKMAHWVAGPMILPPEGWTPRRFRKSTANFFKRPFKAALARGQDGSVMAPMSADGFVVYQHIDGNGEVQIMAPDLNFFPVLQQSMSGRRDLYLNISRREQDPLLFLPPADAKIEYTSTPGGIVHSSLASVPKPGDRPGAHEHSPHLR